MIVSYDVYDVDENLLGWWVGGVAPKMLGKAFEVPYEDGDEWKAARFTWQWIKLGKDEFRRVLVLRDLEALPGLCDRDDFVPIGGEEVDEDTADLIEQCCGDLSNMPTFEQLSAPITRYEVFKGLTKP